MTTGHADVRAEVVVIGAGIAGVSAAAELAAKGRSTVVLERESTAGAHATGRSAALLFRNYGHPDIRPLTAASLPAFEHPDPGLVDGPLLRRRGALVVGGSEDSDRLDRLAGDGNDVIRVDGAEAVRLFPALREVGGGVYEPDAADIDVAALHQSSIRALRRNGGRLLLTAPVGRIERCGSGWRVRAGDTIVAAEVVVDAAGAWGDEIAHMAGVEPVGLTPKRRTAFTVAAPPASERWPLVTDVDMTWYAKPDGGTILCSPADATPSEPCDARPDEVDIARAIDRINAATTLSIRSVRSSWAGLRTFAPDDSMVIGPDPTVPGFVWLVGQGGTGIQTAPAAADLVADLVAEDSPRQSLLDAGVEPRRLAPDRFIAP